MRNWEAATPCPPPETATEHTDPRIAESQAGIDFTNEMFPGFVGMLPTSATGPQECLLIMAFDFRSLVFEGMARVPTYSSWLLQCDMEPAYRYHQRVLKLLQWRCPPERWWLKTPAHMLSIDALDAVYPDARFVMTHRDVGKVLPSVCALYDTLSNVLTERPDPVAIGTHNVELWRTSLERLIEFRDGGNEDRFHDLSFEAVQRDPMAAVAQLYGELGDDLTDDARRRMQDWWTESSKHRCRAAPTTSPRRIGLDLGGHPRAVRLLLRPVRASPQEHRHEHARSTGTSATSIERWTPTSTTTPPCSTALPGTSSPPRSDGSASSCGGRTSPTRRSTSPPATAT